MKKILLFSLLLLVTFAVNADRRRGALIAKGSPSAGGGGGVCTLLISQATNEDSYNANQSTFAQFIKNSSAATVCKVVVRMQANATPQNVTVGLWSTANESGTQYGGNSVVTFVTTSAASYEFTWLINPDVPASDYYVVVKPSLGASETTFATGTDAGGASYENTTYACFRGDTIVNTGLDDLVFEVHTLQ